MLYWNLRVSQNEASSFFIHSPKHTILPTLPKFTTLPIHPNYPHSFPAPIHRYMEKKL
ncbi:MAG: hypothetical protein IIX55_07350 [Muribaculaceae bacterium]|nr:hypothetical protein [Muribaculaceae bacterium]